MNLFDESYLNTWALLLIFGTPLIVLLLSELIQVTRRRGHDDYLKPLFFLRNIVVPLMALAILIQVANFEPTSLIYRLVQTAFWIAVINSVLAFTNVFFFAESDTDRLRAKAPKLFLDLLRFIFVMFGAAVVISQVWGVDLTGLLTALGVGSIVIGLALQDTLGSIFSGIALLSARQFKVGDWINVAGKEGTVTSMTWRSVTITTRSGDVIVLPNTVLAKDRVVNFGVGQNWHSELVDFTFAYDHPPEVVKQVLTEAAHATPVVLDHPAPDARIKEYGEMGIVYQGRIFLPSYQPKPVTRSDYQCMVWYHAQRAGLEFPSRHDRRWTLPDSYRPNEYRTADERLALLNHVGEEHGTLEGLDAHMERSRFMKYRKGEKILPFGRIATGAFIITQGRAEARVDIARSPSDNVADSVVHEFSEGQAVLFKSLFRGEPTIFEVRAATDVDVIHIPRDDFESYLSSNPDFARKVERILSAREEQANRLISRLGKGRKLEGTVREQRIKMLEDMFSE